MVTATEIAALLGVGLAAAAYVPQIVHLVGVRCSAGISRPAFWVWLAASSLVTPHAVATGSEVFVVLGGVQVVASGIILFYATRYGDAACEAHASGSPGAPGRRERPLELRATDRRLSRTWACRPGPSRRRASPG